MLSRFHPRPRTSERCPRAPLFRMLCAALLTGSLFFLPPEEILAQTNFVLNPSIELFPATDLCPNWPFNSLPSHWTSANQGTPEFFDSCSTTDIFCGFYAWTNIYGREAPHTGRGYAGIAMTDYDDNGNVYREYIQGELSTPLPADGTFMISYNASLGDICQIQPIPPHVCISGLQVSEFSSGPLTTVTPVAEWTGTPVKLGLNHEWQRFELPYRSSSSGTDRYIIIGNVSPSLSGSIPQSPSNIILPCMNCVHCDQWDSGVADSAYAYVYIDDVSIVSCDCGGEAMDVVFQEKESSSENCCYDLRLDMTAAACNIYGIKLEVLSPHILSSATSNALPVAFEPNDNLAILHSNSSSALTGPLSSRFLGHVCIESAQTGKPTTDIEVRISYLDFDGNELCSEIDTIPPCLPCCEDIEASIQTVNPENCCYNVSVDLPASCWEVDLLRIHAPDGHMLTVGSTGAPAPFADFYKDSTGSISADICLPPVAPPDNVIILEFLDFEGNVVCEKQLPYSCEGCFCALYSVGIHNRPADENECCFGVDLELLEGACDVADIEIWLNGAEVPSTLRELPWPMNELQSRTNAVEFCLSDTPGQQTVELRLIDDLGNVLCTRQLSADCPCNCQNNGLDFQIDRDYSDGGITCCYDLYVTNTLDCDVESSGILIEYGNWGLIGSQITSVENGEWYGTFRSPAGGLVQNELEFSSSHTGNLLHAGTTIHLGKICINDGGLDSLNIELSLIDDLGNVTCSADDDIVNCDDIDCCDQAMVNIYPSGLAHDCCFDFDPILPPCYTMGTTPFYANVRVCVEAPNVIGSMTGISTSPQCLFFNNLEVTGSAPGLPQFCFAAPPDEPRQNITFTFLDPMGQVICEKTVTIECYEMENSCCGDFSIYTQDDPSYFGPLCCKLINVYQDPMSSCVVGSIELQGPEVGGGLNPVPGGAIHNPGSPPAVLPGVTVGAYCASPGQSGTVKIIIRDNAGYVICVRYIDYDCPAVPPSPKQGFNDSPEIKQNGRSGHDILSVMPQPASSEFNVSYSLSQEAEISLTLFDELGIPRAQLDAGMRTAGQHSINFDASGLNSGVYFLRLDNGIEVTSIPIRIVR